MSESNLIDVVIPVYNGEKYIGETLNSVVRQTYPPKRIIVIDDASTDSSREIIEFWQSHYPCIDVIYHPKNMGLSATRNTGIRYSTSPFIALVDADDIWEPTKLERQMSVFLKEKSKKTGVVYCDILPIDICGNIIEKTNSPTLEPKLRGNVLEALIMANRISGSASGVLIRRECFDIVGLFDETLPTCEDWDMWLRISVEYDFDYVNEKLVRIRHHQENMSKNQDKMLVGRVLVLYKLLLVYPENNLILNELRYQVCRLWFLRFLTRGNYRAVREYVSEDVWQKLFTNYSTLIPVIGKGVMKVWKKIK